MTIQNIKNRERTIAINPNIISWASSMINAIEYYKFVIQILLIFFTDSQLEAVLS